MTDDLDAAYALKTPDDSRELYGAWAKTYDHTFVSETGYVLHSAVADAFVKAGGTGPVLDVGAGTGLCGQVLYARDVGPLHGTDISNEMLAEADRKKCYERLFVGDILAGLPVPDAEYSGIVSSGTFTLGHVGPEGLDEVVRVLKPGGLAVISVRDVHFLAADFEASLLRIQARLSRFAKTLVPIYAGSEHENANDKAFLLHLRK